MKKIVAYGFMVIGMLALGGCASGGKSNPDEITLGQAIAGAAGNMETRLKPGTKLALFSFSSPSEQFSEYVLDEITSILVNNGKLVVVDRENLDAVRKEQGFQVSGEVSDQSAQAIGQMLGAQSVATGKLSRIGSSYHLSLRVISVEKASVEASYTADIAGDERVKALLGGAKVAEEPKKSGQKEYQIGDRGPAGGIVFYDKGAVTNGWRYLEAGLTDFTSTQWGAYKKDVGGTERGIGTGRRNTELIVAALGRFGETGRSAQLCANYDLGGYHDWFLPSLDELNLMYTNLTQKGLGGFSDGWYWSSSENDDHYAWIQDFTNGKQYAFSPKSSAGYVRVVRQF